MNQYFKSIILKSTGANAIQEMEVIQNLWSNYGQIIRVGLKGTDLKSAIVKHVRIQESGGHPRGWNSSLSYQRKRKSYQVETNWYRNFSSFCDHNCRIPKCYAVESKGDEVLMVLEDLDLSGFPVRKQTLTWSEMKGCLSWLAHFHGTFMGMQPEGLWETGTYWHLETRSEELEVLDDIPLKKAASLIDQKLKESKFKTLVHGDAKLANFCFSKDGEQAAAVDFQYVGGGCGMKDLAYFIGSCLNEEECESMESQILDFYFSELKSSLKNKEKVADLSSLEEEWRNLFYVAWADFHRFLKGWSPGHWKINSYNERVTRNVILALQEEK